MKIITAKEMARIEKLAYQSGIEEELFMQKAGEGIALEVERFIKSYSLEQEITILIGKGNKGGDGFTAGAYLLERGFAVVAVELFSSDEISLLAKQMRSFFIQKGGRTVPTEGFIFPKQGVVLDALLGTGFQGSLKTPFVKIIEKANASSLPLLAIDIPSGLEGNTGAVSTIAIKADLTITLGLPKSGLFLKEGWNHAGKVVVVDFGLPSPFIGQAQADFLYVEESSIADLIPKVVRNRHKYEAGYLLGIAGGKMMSGAAKLSALASLRSGAGIIRLFYPEEAEREMSLLPYEVIGSPFQDRIEPIIEEMVRARSCFIGPGLGRGDSISTFLSSLLPKLTLPTVLDADALYFLSKYPHTLLPKHLVLTPHRKEMLRLLGEEKVEDEKVFFAKCQAYAEKRNCSLVLKGAPTVVFHPGRTPFLVPRGHPGMATAGSGDVLTGIIGALLAEGLTPAQASVVGVYLHAVAGEIAGNRLGAHSMIASDIIAALPDAFLSLQKEQLSYSN